MNSTSVSSAPALDLQRLGEWLERNVESFHGLRSAARIIGGNSNPIWRMEAESGAYVLRTQPAGELLQSAHALDREFRVLRALARSDVPVAPVHVLCNEMTVIGVQFYLMDFVDGRVHRNVRLDDVEPENRGVVFDAAIDILAAIHRLDVTSLGLSDFGRAGNYFERQLHRWMKQASVALPEGDAAFDALADALRRSMPAEDRAPVLLHGDFRLDNLMFSHLRDRPVAVLDWELATLGNPLADLGQFLAVQSFPPDFLMPGLAGCDRRSLGIPEEGQQAERYFSASGQQAPAHLGFYKAFALFRHAAMSAGLRRRALLGTAVSEQSLAFGHSVSFFAELGLDMLRSAQRGDAV
jgi:aminoglycoside phosphotransferase (APT) family kinase protein